RAELDRLFSLLSDEGRVVHGPTVRDGAIVDAPLSSASELPIGWTDRQEPGRYRLERRADEAVFGFVVGPGSPKSIFFPPEETLYRAERIREWSTHKIGGGVSPMGKSGGVGCGRCFAWCPAGFVLVDE
ncbi:MAG: 4Fe-4S dicluster domain-containing protein, partial [Deltaproteobacteria bacterium]